MQEAAHGRLFSWRSDQRGNLRWRPGQHAQAAIAAIDEILVDGLGLAGDEALATAFLVQPAALLDPVQPTLGCRTGWPEFQQVGSVELAQAFDFDELDAPGALVGEVADEDGEAGAILAALQEPGRRRAAPGAEPPAAAPRVQPRTRRVRPLRKLRSNWSPQVR